MLRLTADDIENLDLENANVRYMDAEALDFSNACFDFGICGFSLYEFYNLDPALSEVLRVLKSKGVFAASLWGRNLDVRWDGFRRIVKSYRGQMKQASGVPIVFQVLLTRAEKPYNKQNFNSSLGVLVVEKD